MPAVKTRNEILLYGTLRIQCTSVTMHRSIAGMLHSTHGMLV